MKHFTLDGHMCALIGGVFYPTGHSVVMFPSAEDASRVGHHLIDSCGFTGDEIYLIPPDTMLSEIAPTVREADLPMPSAGTEGATVRAFIKLARDGHTALLVKTRNEEAAERLMREVRKVDYSIAQRYRTLVIEDL